MNVASPQTDFQAGQSSLAERCRQLGACLLAVDLEGRVLELLAAAGPVAAPLLESPLLSQPLAEATVRWAQQSEPVAAELFPGCWALPLVRVARKKRVGFDVAVVLSERAVSSEQFLHLCGQASMDVEATGQLLAAVPIRSAADAEHWGRMLGWMAADLGRVRQVSEEVDQLSSQLGETYEELSLAYKLAGHMTVTEDPDQFLEQACAEIQQVTGFRWFAIQLSNGDDRLQDLRGRLLLAGDLPCHRERVVCVGRKLIRRFGHVEPMIISDTRSTGLEGLSEVAGQMLVVPIQSSGRPLAVVFGADKTDGSAISSVDSKLVTSAAQNMGIFLENAMLYEDMQDMFMGTLRSLVSAIDAKDTYTCGHSERVAWASRQLAEAAGLDEETVERVNLSALVHDVGKIGVPEAVLTKPGKLTDEQFMMMKAHPEIGARILRDIRQMRDLIPGVLHHHERWDGRGYPHGLGGNAIPLFGRVICLADTFDAMSSNRPYRKSLPHGDVLEEILRCAGTQFDPALAEIFVNIDFEPFRRMVADHQNRQSPLSQALRSSI